MKDTMVYFGDAVKALGEGKVGGYLVRWGGNGDVDLTGDYFTKETDLGISEGDRLPVYYEHGYDPVIKSRKLGRGTISRFDDVGVWFEAQLELRDEYERKIYALAEAGKLGWSSQAGGSLVAKETGIGGTKIATWPLAEATLTKSPAEYRNTAIPLKSIYPDAEEASAPTNHEEDHMAEEIKTSPPIDVEEIVKGAVAEALKMYESAQPKVKGGYDVSVTEDETDRSLKANPFTAAEFFQAVKMAEMYPGQEERRLLPFKATGLNETTPSQGGYLLPPQIAAGIHQNMWSVGSVLSRFNPIRVTGNSLTINAVDETSRADGSRMGGVRGYWLAEAAQKTASKPKFRQIELKLKKVAALCYATDELLADASALESWIGNEVPNELRFNVEAAIINGDGVGKPLGILQSGALKTVAKRTDASEIDAYDIGKMWAARLPGYTDYVWFVNPAIYPQLLNLTIGDMPVFAPSIRPDVPFGSLLGRPVIENEYCPNLGTAGDILLASPSAYALITKGGIEAASSIHIKFDYDETAFRFVYRVDGQPYYNAAITAYDTVNTVSPFVALSAST